MISHVIKAKLCQLDIPLKKDKIHVGVTGLHLDNKQLNFIETVPCSP